MAENRAAPSALVRELLSAVRAAPGEQGPGLARSFTASGIGPAEAEELLAAVDEAQRLTGRLRRRAAELEALFSTARELVRLRDVGDVLRRLVERAHELMGTDVTYLSEVEDARGDLRVRYSAGTVTPEFRDLLVPAGYGLASLVAETREPAWVSRYTRMSEAPHDPAIDDAVAREGLVSFLGVPLAVGDEVLGALFACNRFAHDFTPDQVLLLSAFADHAAAVLHSARLLADSAAARAHAETAFRELERHVATTEIVSGIHEELTGAVMSGATIVDIVATLSARLERAVWAVDEHARPLDASAGARGGLPPRRALDAAIRTSRSSGHAEPVVDGGRRWLVVAILGADRVQGAMVADGDADDEIARPALERAAQVAALVSFTRAAVSALRAERRSRVLTSVLDGAADVSALVAEGVSSTVAAAVIETRGREGALAAAADAVGEDGIVAVREAHLAVVWAVDEAETATERVRQALAAHLGDDALTAVVGPPFADARSLRASVDRAARDLRFLGPLGITAATLRSDDFAPYHALTSADADAAPRFVEAVLGPVRAWDDRRGTALVETLAAYFDAGGSRQAAAAALHVHSNTVQQRLDRAWDLLDGDPDDAEYRFRVQAAVRLERLRRALGGRG